MTKQFWKFSTAGTYNDLLTLTNFKTIILFSCLGKTTFNINHKTYMKLSISFKIHLDKKKLNYFKHIYEISFRINSFNSRCICKMKTIFTSDNPFEFLSFPEIGRINTFSSDKVSWFIGISLLHKWMKVLDQDIKFKVFKNQKLHQSQL